ncbi:MAG: EAL domain-containing protein, partial [Microcoleus sp. T3-bin5]|nr:EAL domain-containing protein [Microcoleus sp. T3-bin5]
FDELARSTCLDSIAAHNNALKFFINVLPNALIRDPQVIERNLKRVLDLGLRPQQIIFELTEIEDLAHTSTLHQIINRIRDWGFLIAVDDLCSCTWMDNYFLEFRPDIVKIDRRLVHGCSRHTLKQILLKSTLNAAHEAGIFVVAEGLEDLEDINLCRDLGVDMGQGFGLGRPAQNLWEKSLDLCCSQVSLAS